MDLKCGVSIPYVHVSKYVSNFDIRQRTYTLLWFSSISAGMVP